MKNTIRLFLLTLCCITVLFLAPSAHAAEIPQDAPWLGNVLMAEEVENPNDYDPFLGTDIRRGEILSIEFLIHLDPDMVKSYPENRVYDISEAQNGSILMLVNHTGQEERDALGFIMKYCHVIIASEGGVNARNCENLFAGCRYMRALNFNGCFHTDQAENMRSMFTMCMNLQELDLSSFNTSRVTDMSTMFRCFSAPRLDLSSFDTSNVTDMFGMFSACHVPELDLAPLNTSKVTDMAELFRWSTISSLLTLSALDTSKVTSMFSMFDTCSNLTELDLSTFDTSNVTNMSCMFLSCTNLVKLDVSSFDTSQVTDFQGMFAQCSSLPELDIRSFRVLKDAKLQGMFAESPLLTEETVME